MSILFFIHTFVLATLVNTATSIVNFLMVDIKIILGVNFHSQISSVHLDRILMLAKFFYHLYGLPYALKIWIYECASQLKFEIANERMECHPKNV